MPTVHVYIYTQEKIMTQEINTNVSSHHMLTQNCNCLLCMCAKSCLYLVENKNYARNLAWYAHHKSPVTSVPII